MHLFCVFFSNKFPHLILFPVVINLFLSTRSCHCGLFVTLSLEGNSKPVLGLFFFVCWLFIISDDLTKLFARVYSFFFAVAMWRTDTNFRDIVNRWRWRSLPWIPSIAERLDGILVKKKNLYCVFILTAQNTKKKKSDIAKWSIATLVEHKYETA